MPRMKRLAGLIKLPSTAISVFTIFASLFLAGCQSGMPQLFWSADDNTPDYARSSSSHAQGDSRVPLDVPPELRKDIEMPMPDQVAVNAARGDQVTKAAVAGKAIALNQRSYPADPATVFSATVDAMTYLNMPVQSVDSPSGVITSDWIRPNSNSDNSYLSALTGMVGAGPVHVRYRFIVRVFRAGNDQSILEIRTLGQQFANSHWVNKQIKKKVSLELFSAVEEQLARLKKTAAVPDQAMPGQMISDKTAPDQTSPDQTVPNPVPASGDQVR